MAGPKYVDKFEFPSSFGFSGSATDKTTTTVRSHERARPQRQNFAEGGRVRAKPDERTPPPRSEERPKSRPRGSVVDALRGKTRREREAELGLANGGPVHARKRLAMGGPVKAKRGGTVRGPKGGFNRTPLIGK